MQEWAGGLAGGSAGGGWRPSGQRRAGGRPAAGWGRPERRRRPAFVAQTPSLAPASGLTASMAAPMPSVALTTIECAHHGPRRRQEGAGTRKSSAAVRDDPPTGPPWTPLWGASIRCRVGNAPSRSGSRWRRAADCVVPSVAILWAGAWECGCLQPKASPRVKPCGRRCTRTVLATIAWSDGGRLATEFDWSRAVVSRGGHSRRARPIT